MKVKKLPTKTKFSGHGFDVADIVLLVAGTCIFTIFFIVSLCNKVLVPKYPSTEKVYVPGGQVWTTYIAFACNVANVINMLLTVKKKISNCYFGIATSILTGLITFAQGLIGQTVRYGVVGIVGQTLTLIVGLRASHDKSTVKTHTASGLYFGIMMGIVVAVSATLTGIETNQWFANVFIPGGKPLKGYMAIFDALPLTALIASVVLILRRENQYGIVCYIMTVSTLILGIMKLSFGETSVNDGASGQMLAGALLNLGFTIKGHIEGKPAAK